MVPEPPPGGGPPVRGAGLLHGRQVARRGGGRRHGKGPVSNYRVVGEPLCQNVNIKKITGSGGHKRFEG